MTQASLVFDALFGLLWRQQKTIQRGHRILNVGKMQCEDIHPRQPGDRRHVAQAQQCSRCAPERGGRRGQATSILRTVPVNFRFCPETPAPAQNARSR